MPGPRALRQARSQRASAWAGASCRRALAVFAMLSTLACSDSPSGTESVDETPPAPVDDLTVVESAVTSLVVSWTAMGDDGSRGTATFYDVRAARTPLTEETWPEAQVLTGEPAPGPAGSEETMRVVGLIPDTVYWIGVRALDEAGNLSGLGTVASARTLPALATGFRLPLGLHWDAGAERLLVCDNGAGEILSVAMDGTVASAAQIPHPVSISQGPDGSLLITSGGLGASEGALLRWDMAGQVDTLLGGDAGFGPLTGLAVGDSTIFFAEGLVGRVWRWDPASEEPELHREIDGIIGGLALDSSGDLHATDLGSGSVLALRDAATENLTGSGAFSVPLDIIAAPSGDFLVSEAGTAGGIFRVGEDGAVHRLEGSAGPVAGLALDDAGDVFYSTVVSVSGEDAGAVAKVVAPGNP